ncbi:MAG: YraN family protein [Pseudomonadota bacterium]|nr:YraN family protein [Pseudomonadota bacterium]
MRAAGDVFELRACAQLERAGLKLITRNYTTRHGELDLVMLDHHTIVFVEVRYRKSASHGDAAASVTAGKQHKLIMAAQQWLAKNPHHAKRPCRFDVMSYDGPKETVRNEWLRGAFEAG